jgi:hypothetical protein
VTRKLGLYEPDNGRLTKCKRAINISMGWQLVMHLTTSPYVHAGYNDVLDDAKMGWARYAHSMRVFVFNSGLFYIQPTLASLDLLDRIAHRLDNENGWDQAIFNEASLVML